MKLKKGEILLHLTEKEKGVIAWALYERYISLAEVYAVESKSETTEELKTIEELLQQLGYKDLLTLARDTLKRETTAENIRRLKEAGLYVAKEK